MADWNAELYSRFEKERTLPSYDLVRAVEGEPKTVLDIGCGIGNSTQVVAEHFPHARVVGADNSPDMLRYSREKHPELEFITLDAAHDLGKVQERYDLVFSNACLQWLPGHEQRIREMLGLLNEVTHRAHWADRILSHRPYNELTEEEYFDILSENASDFRMWEITYFLRMPSCESILEWYRGTSLRPYLAQLSDEDKREFEAEILEGIREIYPVQRSGEIIFRFPRLFFTAKR